MNPVNWANFQTYNDSPTKAFEVLCNQLFENWCKEQYSSELVSFHVVNGAGGDGGVESYAVLSDGKIIGLQAKWFPDSITNNQMGQIKNPIITALKIRPQITRYIICVPRDLASLTGKGDKTEDRRWEDMKSEVRKDYSNLTLDLWNESRLTQELQKDCSAGIFKFWFERSEISEENVAFSFEKCKNSWLTTKYTPELNTFGTIHSFLRTSLGDVDQRRKLNECFSGMNNLCDEFYTTSRELIDVCGENDPQLVTLLNESKSQLQDMQREVQKVQCWLENETVFGLSFDENTFRVDFGAIAAQLKASKEEFSHYFHFSAVTEVLQSLGKIRIQPILNQIKCAADQRSLVFLGEPGTGKTHGAAAEAERLLNDSFHVPILIQARDISTTDTWKDILTSTLGLANTWSEEEIWQGLSSLANRKRIHVLDASDHVSVLPKIIVFFDGVDESSLQDKWIERVQETRAITDNYPSIRFCFMSRPYVFKGKETGGRIVNLDISGDVPTYKLFDSYVKAYDVDISSAGWVKYALTTPLALKLFCELNKGKKINYHALISLNGYSCFESSAGIETNLFLSTILIAVNDVDSFISMLNEDSEPSSRIANPFDWNGGCSANCYVTPKEVCWMPWKKRYDSSNVDDFPELKIQSAVDECTYNFIELGDVCYELPSAPIREILQITDTDGYLFFDRDKQIKAVSISVGENWRTQQCNLLVDKIILQNLERTGNTLLWIMREDRRENVKAKEKFGDFYAEKDCSYVGFFRNEEFVVIRISAGEAPKADTDKTDELLADILTQCGYTKESFEKTEQIVIQVVEESLL